MFDTATTALLRAARIGLRCKGTSTTNRPQLRKGYFRPDRAWPLESFGFFLFAMAPLMQPFASAPEAEGSAVAATNAAGNIRS
jgi:hypothetical protein